MVGKRDILYVARLRKEGLVNQGEHDRLCLRDSVSSSSLRLRPLPTVHGLHSDVGVLPQAKYHEQAKNRMIVGIAILRAIMGMQGGRDGTH